MQKSEKLIRILQAADEGRLEHASKLLNDYLKLYLIDLDYLLVLATLLIRTNNLVQAKITLERALTLNRHNLTTRETLESVILNINNQSPEHLNHRIAVYVQGRVGSTCVYKSLKLSGLKPYHFHSITNDFLDLQISKYGYDGWFKESKEFLIRRKSDPSPWRILTGVRDPVAQFLADWIGQLNINHPELYANCTNPTNETVDKTIELFLLALSNPRRDPVVWFVEEMFPSIGFKVLDHPFNPALGYAIYKHNNDDILVYRSEDLKSRWNDISKIFLGIEGKYCEDQASTGDAQTYAKLYSMVKERLKVPRQILLSTYDDPYSQHFYSEDERRDFIAKWARL